MATIEIKNFSFSYPGEDKKVLNNLNLNIEKSEFVVLCGKSGCGKSTFLRQLKKNLIPYGTYEGETLYNGEEIADLDDRVNATEIGFVQQNPDNQIVTDKVWHELAFGLESLGLSNDAIQRRVAEMASFFDIQTWFRQDTAALSGGQKQLLNLASIMVMQPKVLILDEPTSQLDPIAASDFIKTVHRINRELGTTVIISEHRLEEVFPIADRVIVMDDGQFIADDSPRNVGRILFEKQHPMFYGLPSVMKIYSDVEAKDDSPLDIREGRIWLEKILGEPTVEQGLTKSDVTSLEVNAPIFDPIVLIEDLWFRYSRDSEQVLRGLNLAVNKGEFFCLLGGNGVGKSTTLKCICGIEKPQRGSIKVGNITVKKATDKELFTNMLAMLPQNPQSLFTEITVEEELLEALYGIDKTDKEKVEAVRNMLSLMEIEHLAKNNPYDLSGGEQQRLALGKILLLEPKILLLDEPTKGLDPFFKQTLAGIFKKLKEEGVTIFMVSHDIEFCAEYADKCALFFDGNIVSVCTPHEFFGGNNFYTTTANRMARAWFPDAVTCKEVVECVKATL